MTIQEAELYFVNKTAEARKKSSRYLMSAKQHQTDLDFLCFGKNSKTKIKDVFASLNVQNEQLATVLFRNLAKEMMPEIKSFYEKIFYGINKNEIEIIDNLKYFNESRKTLFGISDVQFFHEKAISLFIAKPNDVIVGFIETENETGLLSEIKFDYKHFPIEQIDAVEFEENSFKIEFLCVKTDKCTYYLDENAILEIDKYGNSILTEHNKDICPCTLISHNPFKTNEGVDIAGSPLSELVEQFYELLRDFALTQKAYLSAAFPTITKIGFSNQQLNEAQVQKVNERSFEPNLQDIINQNPRKKVVTPTFIGGQIFEIPYEASYIEGGGGQSVANLIVDNTKIIFGDTEALRFILDTLERAKNSLLQKLIGKQLDTKESFNELQVNITLESQKNILSSVSKQISILWTNVLDSLAKLQNENNEYYVYLGNDFFLQNDPQVILANIKLAQEAGLNAVAVHALKRSLYQRIAPEKIKESEIYDLLLSIETNPKAIDYYILSGYALEIKESVLQLKKIIENIYPIKSLETKITTENGEGE